jgi:hypothetical protein
MLRDTTQAPLTGLTELSPSLQAHKPAVPQSLLASPETGTAISVFPVLATADHWSLS